MTEQTQTQTTESKEPNRLDRIHAAWAAAGSKEPSLAVGKKAAENVEAAYLKLDKIELELAKARDEAHAACENLANLYGKRSFTFPKIGNVMLTCRGERIMLRVESHKERISF